MKIKLSKKLHLAAILLMFFLGAVGFYFGFNPEIMETKEKEIILSPTGESSSPLLVSPKESPLKNSFEISSPSPKASFKPSPKINLPASQEPKPDFSLQPSPTVASSPSFSPSPEPSSSSLPSESPLDLTSPTPSASE